MSTRVRATAIGAAVAAFLLTAAACGSGSGDEATSAEGSQEAKSYDVP